MLLPILTRDPTKWRERTAGTKLRAILVLQLVISVTVVIVCAVLMLSFSKESRLSCQEASFLVPCGWRECSPTAGVSGFVLLATRMPDL